VGCLVALLALAVPRVTLFFMWIFSERLSIAFDSFVVGFLGFLILPYTTVFYALAYAPIQGVNGFGWFLVLTGFVMDLASLTNGGREGRRRDW
jgi:hypothetical protein